MAAINNPIVNQPTLYIHGYTITQGAVTIWTLQPGMARDSTNTADIILQNVVTVNTNKVGINALDKGVISVNTFYAMHVVGDSTGNNPTGALLSLSPNLPSLPFGYDMFRRVGWVYTYNNGNSTNLFNVGTGKSRTFYYNTDAPVILTNGNATVFTTVSVAGGVPIYNPPTGYSEGLFKITYTSATAASTVDFGTQQSPTPISSISNGAAVKTITTMWLPVLSVNNTGIASLSYRTTSASDAVSIACVGFKDYL